MKTLKRKQNRENRGLSHSGVAAAVVDGVAAVERVAAVDRIVVDEGVAVGVKPLTVPRDAASTTKIWTPCHAMSVKVARSNPGVRLETAHAVSANWRGKSSAPAI